MRIPLAYQSDAFSALPQRGAGRRKGEQWIYGPFKVFSTDPAKSNSGNIWAALLATVFNGGETPTEAALSFVLPRVEAYFAAMGFMETSSGDMS